MNKDIYTYKDVLLGLREDFIGIKEKLKDLEQYTKVYDENIINYYYFVHKWVDSINPAVMCNITRKNVFNNIKSSNYVMLNDSSSNLFFANGVGLDIDLKRNEEFREKVNAITKEERLNKTYIKFVDGNLDGYDYCIRIAPSEVKGSIINRTYNNVKYDYNLVTDILSISNFPFNVNPKLVYFILNTEYPKTKFNEYTREVIDNSSKKDIVCLDQIGGHRVDLKLIEDKNKIYLKNMNR